MCDLERSGEKSRSTRIGITLLQLTSPHTYHSSSKATLSARGFELNSYRGGTFELNSYSGGTFELNSYRGGTFELNLLAVEASNSCSYYRLRSQLLAVSESSNSTVSHGRQTSGPWWLTGWLVVVEADDEVPVW
ncbi:hypothetical protein Pcinc_029988 [Petrolisthes cinctipes]|uniref:Uncharacterized protein n=1 Tax=Petrolisthes cinctipes TaxID=88211 RepID=A0AAE1EZS8_PETCI|nr:hypothetical protein Pcinc_029988 [Petrolisthes cinctipes]